MGSLVLDALAASPGVGSCMCDWPLLCCCQGALGNWVRILELRDPTLPQFPHPHSVTPSVSIKYLKPQTENKVAFVPDVRGHIGPARFELGEAFRKT